MQTRKNILLTGAPGCGKTTVITRLAGMLAPLSVSGFYTEEIRERRDRVGFRIKTFGGLEGILAHVDFPGRPRVSKYGLDIAALNRIALPTMKVRPGADVFIIDEIGKMEGYSLAFHDAIRRLLDSPVVVVATIALKGDGIISEIKARPDVDLIEVTRTNRDELPSQIADRIRELHSP